jgi:hypothetical protein
LPQTRLPHLLQHSGVNPDRRYYLAYFTDASLANFIGWSQRSAQSVSIVTRTPVVSPPPICSKVELGGVGNAVWFAVVLVSWIFGAVHLRKTYTSDPNTSEYLWRSVWLIPGMIL